MTLCYMHNMFTFIFKIHICRRPKVAWTPDMRLLVLMGIHQALTALQAKLKDSDTVVWTPSDPSA